MEKQAQKKSITEPLLSLQSRPSLTTLRQKSNQAFELERDDSISDFNALNEHRFKVYPQSPEKVKDASEVNKSSNRKKTIFTKESNLECFLNDTKETCSMREFYSIKRTFQRDDKCDKIGFLLKIKDDEIKQFYKQNEYSEVPRYVLQFYHVKSKYQMVKIYQQPLMTDERISHCSLSKDFVVYELVSTNKETPRESKLEIISFKNSEKKSVPNPFKNDLNLSALYIDETVLLAANKTEILQLKLPLFSLLDTKFIEENKICTQIPKNHISQEQNTEIYALWHNSHAYEIEVYVRNLVCKGLETHNLNNIAILRFLTEYGREKQMKEELRKQLKSNFRKGRTSKEQQKSPKSPTLKMTKESSMSAKERFEERLKNKENDILIKRSKSSGQKHKNIDIKNELVVKRLIDFDCRDNFGNHEAIKATHRASKIMSDTFAEAPLLQKSESLEQTPERFENAQGGEQMTKIQFQNQKTVIYRENGTIDYVNHVGEFYSSRNIDFKKLKFLEDKNKVKTSIYIKEVYIDESRAGEENGHNLYFVTQKNKNDKNDLKVFKVNLREFIIKNQNLTNDQAKLSAIHNKVRLFQHYVVYDHIVMVAHGSILSIFNLNAAKCGQKQWQHYPFDATLDDFQTEEEFFTSSPKELNEFCPFKVCLNDIIFLRLREKIGKIDPRVICMHRNNTLKSFARNKEDLQWEVEQPEGQVSKYIRLDFGQINDIIASVQTDSLLLVRHRPSPSHSTDRLSMFYLADVSSESHRKILMQNITEGQRLFQISLSDGYMQEHSQKKQKHRMGIFDENSQKVIVYELKADLSENNGKSISQSMYGTFKKVLIVDNFRILDTDLIVESGSNDFVYLARGKHIYKFYFEKEVLQKKENINNGYLYNESYPNLYRFVSINRKFENTKGDEAIEDFRILEAGSYIYVSTRSCIYFNSVEHFTQSDSLIMPKASICKGHPRMYIDLNYSRMANFNGPFSILIFPFLHTNRLTLTGAHHEPNPIMHQLRGQHQCHLLTKNCELKTWNMYTGKLTKSIKVDFFNFSGYKAFNSFRNRILLCKQEGSKLSHKSKYSELDQPVSIWTLKPQKVYYSYIIVEIINSSQIKAYRQLESKDCFSFFMNSLNNKIFTRKHHNVHNTFVIRELQKDSQQIGEIIKTFNKEMPLHFLSPSFENYILVEKTRVFVVQTQTDKVICELPFYLLRQGDNFSNEIEDFDLWQEKLSQRMAFAEEDLILIEMQGNLEILFQISQKRVINSFNKLTNHFKYNGRMKATEFKRHKSLFSVNKNDNIDAQRLVSSVSQGYQESESFETKVFRVKTNQNEFQAQGGVQDLENIQMPFQNIDMLKTGMSKAKQSKIIQKENELCILRDLMFLNMKFYRETVFLKTHSTSMLHGSREKDNDDHRRMLKLQSVLPFSYFSWKLIDDITTKRTLEIEALSPIHLAQISFSILPNSYQLLLKRLAKEKLHQKKTIEKTLMSNQKYHYMTILHKLTERYPEALKTFLNAMKTHWPQLSVPHLMDDHGNSPLCLALKNKQRRVVAWLLKHLENYPQGYGMELISKCLPEMLKQKFETRVGEFLEKRFFMPRWADKYEVGRLSLNEKGFNATSVNNWPANRRAIDDKFFGDKTREKVPVVLRQLDVDGLHSFSSPDGNAEKFLMTLIESDISIFGFKSIQRLIDYKWEIAYPHVLKWCLLPFTCYLITFEVYLSILFNSAEQAVTNQESEDVYNMIYNYGTQFLLVAFSAYFMHQHYQQMRRRNCQIFNMTTLWGSFELVPMVANVTSIILGFVIEDIQQTFSVQRPLYALAALCLWLKVFYYMRMFAGPGHLVRNLFQIIYQMRWFFFMFLFFVLAFMNSFYALTPNTTIGAQLIYTYSITIRQMDTDSYSEANTPLEESMLWLIFILSSMFFMYILLNMTVSMVKLMYDQGMRIKDESQYLVFTTLIVDSYYKISIPDHELFAKKPDNVPNMTITKIDELNSKVDDYVEETTPYQIQGRPDTLCRQFLLVVSTEVEESEQIYEDQSVKLVKQLRKEVETGFNTVNQRLPKEPKENKGVNRTGLNVDIKSNVDTLAINKGQSFYSESDEAKSSSLENQSRQSFSKGQSFNVDISKPAREISQQILVNRQMSQEHLYSIKEEPNESHVFSQLPSEIRVQNQSTFAERRDQTELQDMLRQSIDAQEKMQSQIDNMKNTHETELAMLKAQNDQILQVLKKNSQQN